MKFHFSVDRFICFSSCSVPELVGGLGWPRNMEVKKLDMTPQPERVGMSREKARQPENIDMMSPGVAGREGSVARLKDSQPGRKEKAGQTDSRGLG